MKRIIGVFTILFVMLAFSETGFATQQEMMKKQDNVMTAKRPTMQTMQKKRKKIRFRRAKKRLKYRKTTRRSNLKQIKQ
jgi:hypothetical protein